MENLGIDTETCNVKHSKNILYHLHHPGIKPGPPHSTRDH